MRKDDSIAGEIPQKRVAKDKEEREGPLCAKFPSLKDNLIEAFKIRGGTFHL